MLRRIDFRLVWVFLSGLTGVIVSVEFVFPSSVVVAIFCSFFALGLGTLVGWWVLRRPWMPPWSGTRRDALILLGTSLVPLIVVVGMVVVAK